MQAPPTNDRAWSLRTKLVLSYLLVILGTILALSFAVSIAAQQFFTDIQTRSMRDSSNSWARTITITYLRSGGDWGQVVSSLSSHDVLLVIEDTTGSQPACIQPPSFPTNNCQNPQIQQALSQALQTQQLQSGTITISTKDSTTSSVYISQPLFVWNRALNQNQMIGVMFITAPLLSGDFMKQTNLAITITGCIIALIAALCSFLFVRRFIQPVEDLKVAAEQMKHGQYTQRVAVPKKRDELGDLALTFNEMASTIEADINELRHQDQLRRDLIANIAHDLATPLTAIQGFSEALADDVITDPETRQQTGQRITREIQRLQRLIADVKQLSSLEAGHAHLDLAPLNMHSLVDETLAVIEPECTHMGISVANAIVPSTPLVLADSDRVTQVLLNLLDNARRHTPTGGKLTVEASTKDKHVFIRVKDTGTGINPADLPHIFDRFYRADRSRTAATGGSGLGLAIVKAIITAHGGTIWAESAPDQGTTITFTLPIALPTPTPSAIIKSM